MAPIVKFGDREIGEGITGWEASPVNDPNRRGRLTILNVALSAGVDFAATVQVLDNSSTPSRLLFTGIIWSATANADGTVDLELRTTAQQISEQRMGGLILGSEMQPLEKIYSILRLAGVKPEAMRLQGLALPPPLPFTIVTPVDGVRLSQTISIGNVVLASDGFVAVATDDLLGAPAAQTMMLGGESLLEAYRSATCWASTVVEASSLDVADEIGLLRIRRAIGWLALISGYSFSFAPPGAAREYRREAAVLGHPTLGRVAHVRAATGPQRWLRCIDSSRFRVELDASILDFAEARVPDSGEEELWEAVQDWQRASTALDFASKSSALWRGIECYAATSRSTAQLFTSAELDRLREKPPDWLNQEQSARYSSFLGGLKVIPLMSRLEQAIERDVVPISAGEMQAIRRARKFRNKLEHGGIPSESEADDLGTAVSVLGRILFFRLSGGAGAAG